MVIEFCGGVIIKVKIKGFLKNLTFPEEEIIDTFGIKNNDVISYIQNDIVYKLIKENNKIIMQRQNDEFSHEMKFETGKKNKSEYYLKELHHSLEFNIETNYIKLTQNKIDIEYKIKETENIYNYVIELSDKI